MKRILLGQSRLERTKNEGKLMDERKIKQKKREKRNDYDSNNTTLFSLCLCVRCDIRRYSV